ncbi:MAG: serine/threonine protein phosphatase [Clostridia bacterium]|nr:serine/threonine protein phosphatase [Clostridia bacterium]
MNARILNISLPPNRRIIAVSDIHGELGYLRGLLNKTAFGQNDILIIAGDMLEKGSDSLGTLRYIMGLSETNTIFPLLGNCDEWSRAVDETNPWNENYVRSYVVDNTFRNPGILAQMCSEIGFGVREDMDVGEMKAALREAFSPEFDFLRSLPHFIETNNYSFVHGGPPEGDRKDWDAWACMKNDNLLGQDRPFDKWTVVGHWPVVLYGKDKVCANPIIARDKKIISIDGGCVLKDDGQLNALLIPRDGSEDFAYTYYDPFPVRSVKTAQKESEHSAYIRWGDNIVEVILWGEEFSLCRHVRTGYRMEILTKYLNVQGNVIRCNDCTDYVLPLEAGDKVSVVEETGRGYLVKHEGTSGWYFGELL